MMSEGNLSKSVLSVSSVFQAFRKKK